MSGAAAGALPRRPPSKSVNRGAVEAVVAALALGLIVGAIGAALVTRNMRQRFDDRLGALGAAAAARLDGEGRIGWERAGELWGEPGGAAPLAVTVRDRDGAVLDVLPPGGAPLPLDSGGHGAGFTTVLAGGAADGSGDTPVRVVTVPAGEGRVVQAGAGLKALRDDQRGVWRAFLVGAPLVAAVGGLLAWAGARRRRSGRLDEIIRVAAEITPSGLSRRLDPGTEKGELARLAEAINGMLSRMEAGFLAQDRFISEVSHELKTPVSVLLLEAQVLERSDPDALVYAKFVASVEDEMRRLAQLVESFLTLARAKHGDTQVRRVTVDMNETAVEAGQHCYAYAGMRELKLAMTLVPEEDCPGAPIVSGDPDLLRTMIENLLRNAIAVSPRQSEVDLRVTGEDHHVTVRVRDRGPGVPEALASRIFERFVTADHARQGTKGSGLGLAIAKGIAELHGGQIQFRNLAPSEGGGAEFSARIPLVGSSPTA